MRTLITLLLAAALLGPIAAAGQDPGVEIVSWNWYADPDHGTKGSVIWTVEVKNNTRRTVTLVRVEFASYDNTGKILTSASTHVSNIRPGGTGADTSYATYFGSEKSAGVRIADVRN